MVDRSVAAPPPALRLLQPIAVYLAQPVLYLAQMLESLSQPVLGTPLLARVLLEERLGLAGPAVVRRSCCQWKLVEEVTVGWSRYPSPRSFVWLSAAGGHQAGSMDQDRLLQPVVARLLQPVVVGIRRTNRIDVVGIDGGLVVGGSQ